MSELYHHGVKGMKWGIRRYQKKDGSLTRLGKKHRERALSEIQSSKDFYTERTASYREKVKDAMPKSEYAIIGDRAIWDAESYVSSYTNLKLSEMREKAYADGNIQVGRDYVTDKHGDIKLTELGKQKEQTLLDKATKVSNSKNKKLIDTVIVGGKRQREEHDRYISEGDKIANKLSSDARAEIASKTYKSAAEKKKVIDDVFRKKYSEAEKTGNAWAAEQVWQQWNFVYDELEIK